MNAILCELFMLLTAASRTCCRTPSSLHRLTRPLRKKGNPRMKKTLGVALMMVSAFPVHAQSDVKSGETESNEGILSITFGALYSTRSLTGGVSTRPELGALFDVAYVRGRFFASTSGVGYNFFKTEKLMVGAGLGYLPEREEAGDSRLRGLGDVAASPTVMLTTGWSPLDFMSVGATLTTASKRENGSFLTLGTSLGFPIYDKLTGSVALAAELANRNYAQTYYGVTAAQSMRSGYRELRPKAGLINTSASVGMNYELTKEWSLGGSIGATRLQGDAAKSPIFIRRTEYDASLYVSYTF